MDLAPDPRGERRKRSERQTGIVERAHRVWRRRRESRYRYWVAALGENVLGILGAATASRFDMAAGQRGAIAAPRPLAAKPVSFDHFGDVAAHRSLGVAEGRREVVRAQRLGTREIEDFNLGECFAREFLHRFTRPLPCLDALFVEHEHEGSCLLRR